MPIIEDVNSTERTLAAASRDPIRVLHVINGEHYAGAERVQDRLALRLPEFGYEVGFACVKPDRFDSMRSAGAAPLVKLPMRSRFDLRPASLLASLVRREHYALIHTHTPRAALVGSIAAAQTGVPMVHHMHGQTSTEVARRWLSSLSAFVERTTVRRAVTIAVSASLGRHLRANGYAKRKVVVVPNGVPGPDRLPPPRTRTGDAWTIGTLAMFRPRKGIETLLEAIAALRSRGHDVRLRAVGGFETAAYEHDVKSFAARLRLEEAVEWTGFRRDIESELAAMDLLVLPSLISEGMPMSLLEAMAAGVPMIGTRVDGIVDVIRDGVDGLLTAPGDANDLARAIERIVLTEIDVPTLRDTAFRRYTQEFSDRSMAAGVAAVYDEIFAGRARSTRSDRRHFAAPVAEPVGA